MSMRRPGSLRRMATGGLLLIAFAAPVRADEEGGASEDSAASRSAMLHSAIDALRLRLQARLDLAALLERQGRLDEAIEVLRGVEDTYARGWEDVVRLLGQPPGRPPTLPAPAALDASPRRIAREAANHGLRWLMAHQSPDGRWEAGGFDKWCDGRPAEEGKRPDGLGKVRYDVGVTGLALCAFLGAGYTNRGNHTFAATVSKGLRYLKNVQDREGCFGPRANMHYVYNHAIATLAMVRAYGMTESPVFRGPAQKGLDFIALLRNPFLVWRYGVKPGTNDTSVTGWMMMALHAAREINDDTKARGQEAPLSIDEEAFVGIRTWIERITDPDSGRAGYMERGGGAARTQELLDVFPADKSESMTAVAVLARIMTGEDPTESEMIQKGVALMAALPPRWAPGEGTIDMYYWYYGTLAMHQVGGPQWDEWQRALQSSVVATQRHDGDYCLYKGSWDPIDPWGSDGGRVYSTALMEMCANEQWKR